MSSVSISFCCTSSVYSFFVSLLKYGTQKRGTAPPTASQPVQGATVFLILIRASSFIQLTSSFSLRQGVHWPLRMSSWASQPLCCSLEAGQHHAGPIVAGVVLLRNLFVSIGVHCVSEPHETCFQSRFICVKEQNDVRMKLCSLIRSKLKQLECLLNWPIFFHDEFFLFPHLFVESLGFMKVSLKMALPSVLTKPSPI